MVNIVSVHQVRCKQSDLTAAVRGCLPEAWWGTDAGGGYLLGSRLQLCQVGYHPLLHAWLCTEIATWGRMLLLRPVDDFSWLELPVEGLFQQKHLATYAIFWTLHSLMVKYERLSKLTSNGSSVPFKEQRVRQSSRQLSFELPGEI